ncbi:hypothetical protein RYX36_014784 [Vicia faba]
MEMEHRFKKIITESPKATKRESSHGIIGRDDDDDEWVKLKMREWATAVASNNETNANRRVSEILLIINNHRHNHMRGN